VLGGLIYYLGWAGVGVWPLACVSLVPVWIALELSLERSWQGSLGVGWVYGTVMIAAGYHWLVPFFEVFSGYGLVPSLLFWLAFAAFIGLQYGVYGLAYFALRRRGWSVAASAVPAFVVLEWLYPKLFPVFLANSFHPIPIVLQIADLGGPLLVTFVAVLFNLAIFETWRFLRSHRNAPRAVWALSAASLVLTLAYGAVRIGQVEAAMAEAPELRLGIVQVNMGIFAKRSEAEEGQRRHVEQSLELEEQHGELDLIVWPESAYILTLPRRLPFSGDEIRKEVKSPILFGGLSADYVEGRRRDYNTAFMMNAEGDVESSYDKTFLLMFGEYLPFGETFPVLYDLSPNSGRFISGSHVRPLRLGPWRIATPICYEDVLPGFTRKMVREGDPHVLINITNDSWFGDTQEPWIHLVLAQLRAIEHRRYMVRATNSGISGVIDPVGRIVARTGVLTRENLRYDVQMLEGQTVYARLGDWPGWVGLVALVAMLLIRRGSAR